MGGTILTFIPKITQLIAPLVIGVNVAWENN